MKFLSRLSLVVGILALIGAVGVMMWGTMYVGWNMQAKNSYEVINPYPILWAAFGAGVIGGLLTGIGVGSGGKKKPVVPAPTN